MISTVWYTRVIARYRVRLTPLTEFANRPPRPRGERLACIRRAYLANPPHVHPSNRIRQNLPTGRSFLWNSVASLTAMWVVEAL